MVVDGEYIMLKDEVRQERALNLLELEEAGEHQKTVHSKIQTVADQLTELGKLFGSATNGLSSERTYRRQLFQDHLSTCTECLDAAVLNGLLAADDAASARIRKAQKRLNPDL